MSLKEGIKKHWKLICWIVGIAIWAYIFGKILGFFITRLIVGSLIQIL